MKISVREAEIEAAEVRTWTCETCDTMTEPDERYCLHCKLYWEDVRNGLFDRPEDY
jgi:hypothetical protein